MSFGIATYLCRKCFNVWSHPPGMTKCTRCGHIYCDWVNFKEWQIEYEKYKN